MDTHATSPTAHDPATASRHLRDRLRDLSVSVPVEDAAATTRRPVTLIIAGDEPLFHAMNAAADGMTLDGHPVDVRLTRGLLTAIGEVAQLRGRRGVVALRYEASHDLLGSSARAMSQLDARVRLLVFAPRTALPAAADALPEGLGVALPDDVLKFKSDAEAQATRHALRDLIARHVGTLEPVAAPTDIDATTDATADTIADAPTGDAPTGDAPTTETTPTELDPQATAPQALDPNAQLGDVDLVDAILTDERDALAVALAIIRQRGTLVEPGYAATREQVPAGHDATPVRFKQHQLGYLHARRGSGHASQATADPHGRLEPWAQWLGRWLVLDRKMDTLRDMAFKDELTGSWNRRYFDRFLRRILDRAAKERSQVTLMVFDIDDFKRYNDTYGHSAGDQILSETARLMRAVVREHDVVARIGGDEFAVIFWDAQADQRPHGKHPEDVLKAARRFQKAICDHRFPKLAEEAPASLTVSGGLAGFPWDGQTAESLLEHADQMALQSKRQGKNAILFGREALRGEDADVRQLHDDPQ